MNQKETLIYLATEFINRHWPHGLNALELKGSMMLVCKHCSPETAMLIEHYHKKIKKG